MRARGRLERGFRCSGRRIYHGLDNGLGFPWRQGGDEREREDSRDTRGEGGAEDEGSDEFA